MLLNSLKSESMDLKNILSEVQQDKYGGTTKYIFAATIQDHLILPCNSGLPIMDHSKCTYLVFQSSNHIGIQWESSKNVVETLLKDWKESEQNMGTGV